MSGTPAQSRSGELAVTWRLRLRRVIARTRPYGYTVALAMFGVGLVLGFTSGRGMVDRPAMDAAIAAQGPFLQFAGEADAIWTVGVDGLPSVASAASVLTARGDSEEVVLNAARWLAAYDAVLREIVEAETDPLILPARRALVDAIVLSRDAVEVLQRAAREEGRAREVLLAEALRLRQRSERALQRARTSMSELAGQTASTTTAPPRIDSFADLLGEDGAGG